MSGYAVSKLALVKLMEYFGAENPRRRVVTVHPGIVAGTEGGQRMVEQSGIAWPGDDSKSHTFLLFILVRFNYQFGCGGFFFFFCLERLCLFSQSTGSFPCLGG